MPTGGVNMPMASLTTTSTPNCTVSTCICGVSKASTGTTSSKAAVVSMTQPTISSSPMISNSSPVGGSDSELTNTSSKRELCCMASSQPKILAMAMMNRIAAAVTWERTIRLGNSLQRSSRLITVPTSSCLLYTSDAADDLLCVDLG